MSDKNIVFGRHPVVEAINAGQSIDKIFILQTIKGEFEKEVRYLSRTNNIPLQYVPKEKLNKITRANHQGIIALVSAITYQSLEDLVPHLFKEYEVPLLLMLDGITDIRNIGAIARTAEAMGVHALVIPNQGGGMINADAIKTSAGALNLLPVCRENSLLKAVGFLQNSDFQVVASDLKAETQLEDIDFKLPTTIILGSEGKGIHSTLLKAADQRFIIPQAGRTDSLNVSVATGIILYEALQQRKV